MSDAPLPVINKSGDDDASELSVESLSRTASLDQGLLPQHTNELKREEDDEDDDDEGEGRQSYLPQQLQKSQSKESPKLSQLQEKWNQSFGSSVGSVNSGDSPVVYATIKLPSIRSSMATTKANNTTTTASSVTSTTTPPVKIDVTTTHTGRSLTPPRPSARKQPKAAAAAAAARSRPSARSPARNSHKTPRKSRMSRSPKRTPATTKTSNASSNKQHTPPPPDMNAGLYYFAQIGPEQSPEEEKPVIETHQGSCQCGEIQLQLRLPSNTRLEIETTDEAVAVEDKIYYRYILAKQADFDIVKGQAFMSTYFVTMFKPPIVTTTSPTSNASVTSASTSSGNSSTRKSKFFLRPSQNLTSPRSQSKGARVFCPQCGVYVLYVPGKNAPKVHLNINCFPTLVQDYPPPPPPPKNSQSLKKEAWFWDYQTYSRFLESTAKNKDGVGSAATGVALLDVCWEWIQDNLGDYLPLIQDFVRDYLLLPSSGANDSFLEEKGVFYLPSDTPKSARESVMGVERAFQGTLTPSGSFLEENSDDDDEEEEDLILDDGGVGGGVMGEDGTFNEGLLTE